MFVDFSMFHIDINLFLKHFLQAEEKDLVILSQYVWFIENYVIYRLYFNRRNYKISVAIILCIVNSHITFHEGQGIFCPSFQYCFYISTFFFYFFLHFVTPKFFVNFYLFQIRTSFSSASSCFLQAQEKNLREMFSICLIFGQIWIVFLSCLNHRHWKISAAIFLLCFYLMLIPV